MRPIKFRQQTPDGWHYWGFIDGSFRSPAIVGGVDGGQSYQYTGLKDKNGTEVYEGDIVGVDGFDGKRNPHPIEVRWVTDKNIGAGFNLRDSGRWYEVIGNIYENPELLGPRERFAS